MQKILLIAALAFVLCGCNTTRRVIGVLDAAASAVGGVKDDVVGALHTLNNSAEAVKTNVTAAATSVTK